ncbi:MAG: hypothetical protein K6A41_10885 [Bacteroidales bacterium]|nr:hypothetical protein [Bacteroidales bacterium]
MKRITDFLNECSKCELEPPVYNGCSDDDQYCVYIDNLYKGAVSAIMEVDSELKLPVVKTRFFEVKDIMIHADFPTPDTLTRIKQDYMTTKSESLKKDYTYLVMAKKCRDMQLYYFLEFSKYLQLDDCEVESLKLDFGLIQSEQGDEKNQKLDSEINTTDESVSVNSSDDADFIKGIRELAKYLRCGINKAEAISKSGVLKRRGVQFMVGNANYFSKKKMEEVLSKNPDLFKKEVHWH